MTTTRTLTASDGVELAYDDLGPRAGPAVVLCHGLAAAGLQLMDDARYFAGLGHRVLVPDLRGHGRSGRPTPMTPEGFAIARQARDMVEMLEVADVGPVHWVGNSMGGILALAMLAHDASRLRTLATFGTAYTMGLPRLAGTAFTLPYTLLGPGLAGWLTARFTTRSRAARPLIAQLVRDFDPAVGRLTVENLVRYDFRAEAAAAGLPILLLRGGRDGAVNAGLGATLEAMRGRPNFTLVELPEGGHCANLDATEGFRRALTAFWDANASGPARSNG